MIYTNLVLIHDIFNIQKPKNLFEILKRKIVTHDRSNKFYCRPTNIKKVGANCFSNRIMNVMKGINKSDLYLSKLAFKMKMKKEFLNPAL